MDNKVDNEKLNKAERILKFMGQGDRVKKIRTDKSIIERTNSSKIILTEDNKQLLND